MQIDLLWDRRLACLLEDRQDACSTRSSVYPMKENFNPIKGKRGEFQGKRI